MRVVGIMMGRYSAFVLFIVVVLSYVGNVLPDVSQSSVFYAPLPVGALLHFQPFAHRRRERQGRERAPQNESTFQRRISTMGRCRGTEPHYRWWHMTCWGVTHYPTNPLVPSFTSSPLPEFAQYAHSVALLNGAGKWNCCTNCVGGFALQRISHKD